VTVDHGLQEGSADRARQVSVTLGRLGLDPVEQVSVSVPGRPGNGGTEAAARAARYAALAEVAGRTGAAAVLLGHTRDDQAETVLLALARGSGARALGGMAARRGIFRRPLLGVGRGTLRDACHALQLDPWDDPHNHDPAYARVRVRDQALPALEAALGPGITEALARTAAQLTADCAALDEIAQAEEWRIATGAPAPPRAPGPTSASGPTSDPGPGPGQRASLDITGLAELAAAIRTRVLRSAALAAGCPGGSLSAGHIAALDALVTGWHGQRGTDLPGAVRAERRYGKLLFSGGRPAGAGPPDRNEAEATGGRE
jgi:tRNA(Ile)-lysidine synthase